MDKILSYMYVMMRECKNKNIPLTEEYLNSLGGSIVYYRGVQTWFDRINAFAETLGVTIEHYIISSGTKEIIEGSSIAKYFKKIYGCKFIYDPVTKEAIWPGMAINYTQKTQYIFRISKGALDEVDEEKLNMEIKDVRRAIQYRNMIYIGDGLSDVPCMKMMRSYGGQAIAVYQAANRAGVEDLLAKGRVDFIFPADYGEGQALEKTVQNIICKIAVADRLWEENLRQLKHLGEDVLPDQVELF